MTTKWHRDIIIIMRLYDRFPGRYATLARSFETGWRFVDLDSSLPPAPVAPPSFSPSEVASQRSAANAMLATVSALAPGSRYVPPPGHYRFSGPTTLTVASDVTIDAPGCTFWLEPDPTGGRPGLALAGAANLTIRSATIDAATHAFSRAAVTSVANGIATAITIPTAGGFVAPTTAIVGGRCVVRKADGTTTFVVSPAATLTGNTVTCRGSFATTLAVGDVLEFPASNAALVSVAATSPRVTLANVTMLTGAPAVADAGGARLVGCRIVRRPDRATCSAAEGVLSLGASTTVEGCEVSHVVGNAIDFGAWFGVGTGVAGLRNASVAVHPAMAGGLVVGAPLRFFDPCNRLLGVANVTAVAPDAAATPAVAGWPVSNVTLDADVSCVGNGTLVDVGRSGRCVLSACHVHDVGGWGVRVGGVASAAVTDSHLPDAWVGPSPNAGGAYRGPYPVDVLVANNFVDGGSVCVGSRTAAASMVHVALPTKPMADVVVRNNTVRGARFRGNAAPGVQAYYVDGLVVSDNVCSPAPGLTTDGAFGCATCDSGVVPLAAVGVYVAACSDVVTSNNACLGTSVVVAPDASPDLPRVPYSIDDPPAPKWSAADIASQKAAGAALLAQLMAAANANASSFVVPPGDYGFTPATTAAVGKCAAPIQNVVRPDGAPFVVSATGATFWTDVTMGPRPDTGAMLALIGCKNVTIEGLTLDTYEPLAVEGKITKIDVANNAIQMELLPGARSDAANVLATYNYRDSMYCKPRGESTSVLYKIDATYGPGNFGFQSAVADPSAPGRFWVTLNTTNLLSTIYRPSWLDAYGQQGALYVGDGMSLTYQSCSNFLVTMCRNVRLANCTAYAGILTENGGDGGHVYANLRIHRRPGTNGIIRCNGQLGGRMRVGSVYEGCFFGPGIDDSNNIMGVSGAQAVAIAGNTVKLPYPSGTIVGDTVEFYDTTSGNLVGSYLVSNVFVVPGQPVVYGASLEFSTTPASNILVSNATVHAYYPNTCSAGWAIRDSYFDNTYQRLLFQTGPGELSNCIVRGLGEGVCAAAAFSTNGEGGFARNITVANNAFFNAGLGSDVPCIRTSMFPGSNNVQRVSGLVVRDNVVLGTGGTAVRLSLANDAVVERNVFVDPLRRNIVASVLPRATACVDVIDSLGANVRVRDNACIMRQGPGDYRPSATASRFVNAPPFVRSLDTANNAVLVAGAEAAYAAAYGTLANVAASARDIVAAVRAAVA